MNIGRTYFYVGISMITMFLTVIYAIPFLQGEKKQGTKVNFIPQQKRTFVVNVSESENKPITIKATTLPQFVLSLLDEKFRNLWEANAQEKSSLVNAQITTMNNKDNLSTKVSFNNANKQIIISPPIDNKVKPGLYTLSVTVKTYSGRDITVTQDFRWGVLAINTDKGVYLPGETVKIGMGVLGDRGNTKCIAHGTITQDTAKVWLQITSPSGKKNYFTTDDDTIHGSSDCGPISVTNNPDFFSTFTAEEVGTYSIHMTAETVKGDRGIDYPVVVKNVNPRFIILRSSYPTRIYPYGNYPVEITVIANEDYQGRVSDFVPNSFQITHMSDNASATKKTNYQQVDWNVNWRRGEQYTLSYEIKFPPISPEFYLVGPMLVGSFSEGREWEIASDAISLIQSASNVANSGTSVSATVGSAITANNLEILICSETGSATINTPSRGSGRSWSGPTTLSVTSTPRIRMFYRRANATDSTTFTCSFNSSSGVKSVQAFEYTGVATSSQLDAKGKLNGSNACNSNPFDASVSLTATNGNELVISSHVATGTRNVNSHTDGFIQEFAFNGSSGTFTSADQLISDPGGYTDTATLSGSGGTCSAVVASFIAPVTLTQNGYRFFENNNSALPGNPLDAQNTDITLATSHSPFRLRFLIDVDGNQTVSIGSIDLILQYAESPISGDCSELQDNDWNPITNTTPIAYNVNSLSGGSGSSIASSGNDPVDSSPHSYTTNLQNYYESFSGDGTDDISNLQNSLANNRAGLWDVSLIDNTDDVQSTTYCLEAVTGDGTGLVGGNLDAYLHYPKVTTFYNEVNIKSGTTIRSGTLIQ